MRSILGGAAATIAVVVACLAGAALADSALHPAAGSRTVVDCTPNRASADQLSKNSVAVRCSGTPPTATRTASATATPQPTSTATPMPPTPTSTALAAGCGSFTWAGSAMASVELRADPAHPNPLLWDFGGPLYGTYPNAQVLASGATLIPRADGTYDGAGGFFWSTIPLTAPAGRRWTEFQMAASPGSDYSLYGTLAARGEIIPEYRTSEDGITFSGRLTAYEADAGVAINTPVVHLQFDLYATDASGLTYVPTALYAPIVESFTLSYC